MISEQFQIEVELRDRVEQTRTRWEEACRDYRISEDLVNDLGMEHRDGLLALSQYLVRQRGMVRASEAYRLALRQFTEMILDQRMPSALV